MEKTFLLGVGAQKAGTTWLYRYLRAHPDCNMGAVKEYAVLNSHFTLQLAEKRLVARLQELEELVRARIGLVRQGKPRKDVGDLLSLIDCTALSLDLGRYPSHFDRLWTARPGVRLVGDITPEYTALEARHFQQVRSLMEGAGYRVKVVLLMRDPVDRCHSALRMGKRRAGKTNPADMEHMNRNFAKTAIQAWCEVRTRYELIIPALEAAFPKEDIFLGFYETLFSDSSVGALCDFLGISPVPANLDKRINASPHGGEPSAEALASVRAHYSATYDFCRDRFGHDFINSIWKNAQPDPVKIVQEKAH